MRKIEPETWKHGTDCSCWRRGGWWKEGEGISQRTCMNDSWTWTMKWGLTVGERGGLGGGGKKGKKWDNIIE